MGDGRHCPPPAPSPRLAVVLQSSPTNRHTVAGAHDAKAKTSELLRKTRSLNKRKGETHDTHGLGRLNSPHVPTESRQVQCKPSRLETGELIQKCMEQCGRLGMTQRTPQLALALPAFQTRCDATGTRSAHTPRQDRAWRGPRGRSPPSSGKVPG